MHNPVQNNGTGKERYSSADFDMRTGSFLERLFFNNRIMVLVLCILITLILGYQATGLQMAASFEKMLPVDHPYIQNFAKYSKILSASTNSIRIIVAAKKGTIFTPGYMDRLRKINDEVYLFPSVERAYMKSLWTPTTTWIAVTEEGLEGGPVMPLGFDGSDDAMKKLRDNIERSGEIGKLVAADYQSSVIIVPLIDKNGEEGDALDYAALNRDIELLRSRYESADTAIYITGFAKVLGDLLAGIRQILIFFLAALVIAAAAVFVYTRCVRSTLVIVTCSLVAVTWLLGLLPTLGFSLNPYSVLVPFLVFAIGMSHGAQKMNGILQDVGRGTPKLLAARLTFRRLFLAGLTALLADGVGFAVLMVIHIPVIQELATAASIGVLVLVFTNLVMVPVLLSFIGVSQKAAARSLECEVRSEMGDEAGGSALWAFLDLFTRRKFAIVAIIVAISLGLGCLVVGRHLKIGDLDPGAPEFRPDSRYNRDNDYMIQHYAASSDLYIVMVRTPYYRAAEYETLLKVELLESILRSIPGVENTVSFAGVARLGMMSLSEGNPKWYELSSNQANINVVTSIAPREFISPRADFLTIFTFLKDHKADTLSTVSTAVDKFAKEFNTSEVQFLSAAGNAGVEAATNIVVKKANLQMLLLVYGSVIVFSFITFRSWRAVLCAVLPLMLTSIMCEALMVLLGIGVKVATLPVISLGVGIGVDYALYVLSILLARLKEGRSLSDAYYRTLLFTGRIVVLTGITLASGVAIWFFSPIKFQSDMGLLLAFMFLWNMIGALVLLPALARMFLNPKSVTFR